MLKTGTCCSCGQVAAAKQLVTDLLQRKCNAHASGEKSGIVNVEVPLKPAQRGFVIGKGGATITRLQKESGARLNLLPGTLSISGTKKQARLRAHCSDSGRPGERGRGRGGGLEHALAPRTG